MEEDDARVKGDVKVDVGKEGETAEATATATAATEAIETTPKPADIPDEGRPQQAAMNLATSTFSSVRTTSGTPMMTPSSTPLGHVNAARRPGPLPARGSQSSGLTQDIQEKMKAFSLSRQGAPFNGNGGSSFPGISPDAPAVPQ
ncbi:hypothetical protein FQN49_008578, partial [Arthroderma sp. PD_2]